VFTFLGVELVKQDGKIVLSQEGLIKKILKTTGIEDYNRVFTPAAQDNMGADKDEEPFKEDWDYASVIGMMMYLCNNAYPENQFAVHQCARFTHFPRNIHAKAVKRICRYLKMIIEKNEETGKKHGLTFRRDTELKLECYTDADYAGLWKKEDNQDPVCVKSITGYTMLLNGNPIHWVSKLQSLVALSTTEAEYIALSQSMRDLLPMRELLSDIQQYMQLESKHLIRIKSTIFEDNNGFITVANAPKMTPRTKHIAEKYHFFKDHMRQDKGMVIKKVESELQLADIFTKSLPQEFFEKLRFLLC